MSFRMHPQWIFVEFFPTIKAEIITSEKPDFELPKDLILPMKGETFLPELPYITLLQLQPEKVDSFRAEFPTQEDAERKLQDQELAERYLDIKDWLPLSFTQMQGEKEVIQYTFWHHFNPAKVALASTSEAEITEGIVNFVKDWSELQLQDSAVEAVNGFLDTLETGLQALTGPEDREQEEESSPLKTPVENVLKDLELPYTYSAESEMYQIIYKGENGQWYVYVRLVQQEGLVLVYSLHPSKILAEAQIQAMKHFTYVNFGMIIGNFEMDLDDGEVRFKTSLDVENDRLSEALFRQLFMTNITTMDRHLVEISNLNTLT